MNTVRMPNPFGPLGPEAFGAMVMLVDDQLIIGEAVRRALADEPHVDFHFCSDPSEALNVASRISPTVILQDLVMPGIDGLDLVRQYRACEATRNTPVVVLSTRDEPVTKSNAFAAGANDYLVKLPDRLELLARIRYHSRAYVTQLQRDEAYRALRKSQQELLETNLELQRLMNMDGLTTLNNRRRFDEYALAEWNRAARERTPLSVVIIDVDDFKPYNDTYGHVAGDDVLKRIAIAIRQSCARPADLAARLGGEEFAVVLPNTPLAGSMELAERIRKAVANLAIEHSGSSAFGAAVTGNRPHVTVSLGCATTVPEREGSFLDLMVRADTALYAAKRDGKNRVAKDGRS